MTNNALTNTENTAVGAAYDPFADAGRGAGQVTYVKFKRGDYLYGQDEDELDVKQFYAADMYEITWNWTFWEDGEVREKESHRLVEEPKAYENEPDYVPSEYEGDLTLEEIRHLQKTTDNATVGWSLSAQLPVRPTSGDAEDYLIQFGSMGGVGAVRSLSSDFSKQRRFKAEGAIPIISLGKGSYKSKRAGVGRVVFPVLKIEDWKTEEELMAAVSGDDPAAYNDDAEPDVVETAQAEEAPQTPTRRGARGRNV